jgi:hypothetical protein
MENEKYVGKGWKNDYGIKVQLKKEDLLNLPTNAYGDIEVFVGQRKEVDPKSRATHWVKWKAKDGEQPRKAPSELHPAIQKFNDNGFGLVEDEGLPF